MITSLLLTFLLSCSSLGSGAHSPTSDDLEPPTEKGPIDSMGPLVAQGRYFVRPGGEVQLLTGPHWGWELQCGDAWEPTPGCFDLERAVRDIVEGKWGNTIRMWTVEHTLYKPGEKGAKNVMHPMPWARTGPGVARDDKPRFDLLKPNPAFYKRLRSRMELLRENQIYGIVMLFQGVSLNTDLGPEYDVWQTLVYNPDNNIQRYPLAKPGWSAHRKTSGPIWEAQKVYLREVVRSLSGLPNVLLEVANEDKHGSIEWQAAVITELRNLMDRELPHAAWPIGATFRQGDGTNEELIASGADWISPKAERGDLAGWRPTGNVPNVLDTDHFFIYATRPDLPATAIANGAAGFLHLDRPGIYFRRKHRKHMKLHQDMMPIREAMGRVLELPEPPK